MRTEYRAFGVGLAGAFIATIPGVSWQAALVIFVTAAAVAAVIRGDRVGFLAAWLGALVRVLMITVPLLGDPEYGVEGALLLTVMLGAIAAGVLAATFAAVLAVRRRI